MRYIKINHPGGTIKNIANKDDVQWRLVLANLEDLVRYKNGDIESTGYHFCHMNSELLELIKHNPREVEMFVKDRTDITDREKGVARVLASKVLSTSEGQKVFLLNEVAGYIDRKSIAMAKHIEKYGPILVCQGGGWSAMDSYFNMWGCQILEDINGINGWPQDNEPVNVKTLILENAPELDPVFNKCIEQLYPGSIGTILNLKQTDQRYIFGSIVKAENICIGTDANDEEQVTNMIKLFMNVERKNIYIMTSENGRKSITENPLYKQADWKHNIKFA